jgi:hypothetical protein
MAEFTCARCGFAAQIVRAGKNTSSIAFDLSEFLRLCKEVEERRAGGQSSGEEWLCGALQKAYEAVLESAHV